jgi:hypothetical protein
MVFTKDLMMFSFPHGQVHDLAVDGGLHPLEFAAHATLWRCGGICAEELLLTESHSRNEAEKKRKYRAHVYCTQ